MNKTIETQLKHRSIRKYKDTPIPEEIMNTLFDVAMRTASSSNLQCASIIRVKDPEIKKAISEVCGQKYITTSAELLIFVADQHRNHSLQEEMGRKVNHFGNVDKFFQGFTDAVLMAQNVVNAAESLGIGTVYLGSILNNPGRIVEILNLPEYTFPALGLSMGYPDEEPFSRPRMENELRIFKDRYECYDGEYHIRMKAYDERMKEYYRERENDPDRGYFRNIAEKGEALIPERAGLLNTLRKQNVDLYLDEE